MTSYRYGQTNLQAMKALSFMTSHADDIIYRWNLQLYALFKVGKGEDFSKAEKPGMFDLKVCHALTCTSPNALSPPPYGALYVKRNICEDTPTKTILSQINIV